MHNSVTKEKTKCPTLQIKHSACDKKKTNFGWRLQPGRRAWTGAMLGGSAMAPSTIPSSSLGLPAALGCSPAFAATEQKTRSVIAMMPSVSLHRLQVRGRKPKMDRCFYIVVFIVVFKTSLSDIVTVFPSMSTHLFNSPPLLFFFDGSKEVVVH